MNGSKQHVATFWFALFILILSAFLNVPKVDLAIHASG